MHYYAEQLKNIRHALLSGTGLGLHILRVGGGVGRPTEPLQFGPYPKNACKNEYLNLGSCHMFSEPSWRAESKNHSLSSPKRCVQKL